MHVTKRQILAAMFPDGLHQNAAKALLGYRLFTDGTHYRRFDDQMCLEEYTGNFLPCPATAVSELCDIIFTAQLGTPITAFRKPINRSLYEIACKDIDMVRHALKVIVGEYKEPRSPREQTIIRDIQNLVRKSAGSVEDISCWVKAVAKNINVYRALLIGAPYRSPGFNRASSGFNEVVVGYSNPSCFPDHIDPIGVTLEVHMRSSLSNARANQLAKEHLEEICEAVGRQIRRGSFYASNPERFDKLAIKTVERIDAHNLLFTVEEREETT